MNSFLSPKIKLKRSKLYVFSLETFKVNVKTLPWQYTVHRGLSYLLGV